MTAKTSNNSKCNGNTEEVAHRAELDSLRSEFATYQTHTDSQFNRVFGAIDKVFEEINRLGSKFERSVNIVDDKIDQRSRPNVGAILGLLTIIIALVGGAWGVINSSINSNDRLSVARDEALKADIYHFVNGNNRFSQSDWHREEQRQIEKSRWEEEKYLAYQNRQDERLRTLEVNQSDLMTQADYHEKQLDQSHEWDMRNQETVNRLDERARYHMEIDDPSDTKPRDVFNELRRIESDLKRSSD